MWALSAVPSPSSCGPSSTEPASLRSWLCDAEFVLHDLVFQKTLYRIEIKTLRCGHIWLGEINSTARSTAGGVSLSVDVATMAFSCHAADFDGRALGVPSRGNATIAANGVRLSTTLDIISSSSGVASSSIARGEPVSGERNNMPVASNLSRTSVVIPQGGLKLSIEGSDWEAR